MKFYFSVVNFFQNQKLEPKEKWGKLYTEMLIQVRESLNQLSTELS